MAQFLLAILYVAISWGPVALAENRPMDTIDITWGKQSGDPACVDWVLNFVVDGNITTEDLVFVSDLSTEKRDSGGARSISYSEAEDDVLSDVRKYGFGSYTRTRMNDVDGMRIMIPKGRALSIDFANAVGCAGRRSADATEFKFNPGRNSATKIIPLGNTKLFIKFDRK